MRMGTKKCCRCHRRKSLLEFHLNKKSPDGYNYSCRLCYNKSKRKYSRRYYWNHLKASQIKHREYRRNNPQVTWANSTLNSHKKRGFTIKTTPKELASLAKNTYDCYICGCVLNWKDLSKYCKKGVPNDMRHPTLDRVNNGRVISKDTVRIACARCNLAKSSMGLETFIRFCRLVVTRLGGKANV